jgi:hypothetical protein
MPQSKVYKCLSLSLSLPLSLSLCLCLLEDVTKINTLWPWPWPSRESRTIYSSNVHHHFKRLYSMLSHSPSLFVHSSFCFLAIAFGFQSTTHHLGERTGSLGYSSFLHSFVTGHHICCFIQTSQYHSAFVFMFLTCFEQLLAGILMCTKEFWPRPSIRPQSLVLQGRILPGPSVSQKLCHELTPIFVRNGMTCRKDAATNGFFAPYRSK